MPRWPATKAPGGSPSAATAAPIRPMLEAALVRGLTEGGARRRPDRHGPLADALFRHPRLDVDGGIQVTGSHNPADYNGFKMLLNGRSVFGAEIQELGRRAAAGDWSEGSGTVEEADIRDAYVDRAASKDFDGQGLPHRLGRRQRRRRADPRQAGRAAARRASRDLHRGRRHLPQPPPRPDGRGQPRRPEGAGRATSSSTSASPSTATATASARSTARAA